MHTVCLFLTTELAERMTEDRLAMIIKSFGCAYSEEIFRDTTRKLKRILGLGVLS